MEEATNSASSEESILPRWFDSLGTQPLHSPSWVDENTETGQGSDDGDGTVRSPLDHAGSNCFICFNPLDQAPAIAQSCYTRLELVEKMVICNPSAFNMPCCDKEAHVPCVSRLFYRCNIWICPMCSTVLVKDLFRSADSVQVYQTANNETDVCVIQCAEEDLRKAHPTVLSNEDVIYHFETGTFSLSGMLAATQNI